MVLMLTISRDICEFSARVKKSILHGINDAYILGVSTIDGTLIAVNAQENARYLSSTTFHYVLVL